MKKISYIILLLFPFFSEGQFYESTENSRIDLGYSFAPEYSYRFLKSNSNDQWIVDNYDSLEFSKFGYSIGINGVYNIKSNFSISSAVLLSNKGFRTKKDLTPSLINYIINYYYLDIPIKVNYYFLTDKFRLYVTGGLSTNVFLKHIFITKREGDNEELRFTDNSSISKINLGINTGIGFDINLTDKWYFKMECLYKQSITPIGNTPIKKYFYSISPNLGFYLHI